MIFLLTGESTLRQGWKGPLFFLQQSVFVCEILFVCHSLFLCVKSAAQRRFAVPSTFLDAEVLQDALAVGKLLGDETRGSEHG